LKAADPDLESQPVNSAGFRNCGDDVPVSFAIDANNAISLPTALQRHLPCPAPAPIDRVPSTVTTNLRRTHHDADPIRKRPIENFAIGYRSMPERIRCIALHRARNPPVRFHSNRWNSRGSGHGNVLLALGLTSSRLSWRCHARLFLPWHHASLDMNIPYAARVW
jgi:hypothetical protein